MPSMTRPTVSGDNTHLHVPKRHSDLVSEPQTKKPRVDPSQTRTRRDSNRDNNKRRRRKKKKAPIVGSGSAFKSNVVVDMAEQAVHHTSGASSSAHCQIMRFPSVTPEIKPTTSKHISTSLIPQQCDLATSPHVTDTESIPCNPKGKGVVECADTTSAIASDTSEDKVNQLSVELQAKNELLASHQLLLNQMQQAVTCQICLDLMHKPFALSPCGHLACYDCLVQWFRAPPQDNRPAPPPLLRRKTCPHCRAVVRERPIEVWGVKNIVQSIAKSNLVANQSTPPGDLPDNESANADPWAGIFSKVRREASHPFSGGDDPDHVPRGEDMGVLDVEDGGIYRCLNCMHEIWNGVCSHCQRNYPGHAYHPDEEGMDWRADEGEDSEPTWMGLLSGVADDIGDDETYHDFGWPFTGGMMGAMEFTGVAIGDEEDDEYEDSFIDDGSPRIYEIRSDDDYVSAYSHSDAEDNDSSSALPFPQTVFFSEDEDGSEDVVPHASVHVTHGVVYSESEAELSDSSW